jgi:hypothetical protein
MFQILPHQAFPGSAPLEPELSTSGERHDDSEETCAGRPQCLKRGAEAARGETELLKLSISGDLCPLQAGQWTLDAWEYLGDDRRDGAAWRAELGLDVRTYDELYKPAQVQGARMGVWLTVLESGEKLTLSGDVHETIRLGQVVNLKIHGRTAEHVSGFLDSRVGDVGERYRLQLWWGEG